MTSKPEGPCRFAGLLRQKREAAGLRREALAQLVKLDVSTICRLEAGNRRPTRDTVLALGSALRLDDDSMNRWLVAAEHVPSSLLPLVRGTVRTRGEGAPPRGPVGDSPDWALGRRADQLEAMGLDEVRIQRILQLLEAATVLVQQEVTRAINDAFSRMVERLDAPVETAVIPAAGGQHRMLASHVSQRLLLRAISEAVRSGISRNVLVLAPGSAESLYTPLEEALELAVVPVVRLLKAEQSNPEGLGDAILQAESHVGKKPFAVLLPDDIVREEGGRIPHPGQLSKMMEVFRRLECAPLLAVTSLPKRKLARYGVVSVKKHPVASNVFEVLRLVEKPEPDVPIWRAKRVFGIVGRYLLPPAVFTTLRELKEEGRRPVELTDALDRLRQAGTPVYAFELEAHRQDVGQVIGQTSKLMGDTPETPSSS